MLFIEWMMVAPKDCRQAQSSILLNTVNTFNKTVTKLAYFADLGS